MWFFAIRIYDSRPHYCYLMLHVASRSQLTTQKLNAGITLTRCLKLFKNIWTNFKQTICIHGWDVNSLFHANVEILIKIMDQTLETWKLWKRDGVKTKKYVCSLIFDSFKKTDQSVSRKMSGNDHGKKLPRYAWKR